MRGVGWVVSIGIGLVLYWALSESDSRLLHVTVSTIFLLLGVVYFFRYNER